MKKLLCLLSAALLVLTSCSNDETSTTTPVSLVKKKIETYDDGSTLTTNYTYNGNKLVKESYDDGIYSNFTYTGDLITGIETFDSNDELVATDVFAYNPDGKLISEVYRDLVEDYGSKETYVYNSDGTETISYYSVDAALQTQLIGTSKYYYLNGEVIKNEDLNGGAVTSTATYTYDNKNNPFKNVTGIGKLQNLDGLVFGISQNIVVNADPDENFINEYMYNSNSYPTIETAKENGVVIATTQYFYE